MKLPVKTTNELWPVSAIGLGENPRLREGKTTPDGSATYASGCILMMVNNDGQERAQKHASVHVVNPATTYELGKKYRAEGSVWVMPYVPDGATRAVLSITVESLVPEEGDPGGARQRRGSE